MFLTRLSELYDRLDTQPSGYELKPTRWVIQLSEDGTWLPPMAETDSLTLSVPTRKRSSNVAPCLFADDPHFILGARVGDDDMEQDKIQERYQSHLALVEECAEQTRDPLVAAAVRFLRESSVEARESVADTGMKPKDFLTIRVGQTFLVELESVRRFWQTKLESETAGKSVFRSQCIVCGNETAILSRHTVKLPYGEIVSANAKAFESYGLQNSEIAPTCADCAERYGKALIHLSTSENNRYHVAGTQYLFWTRSGRVSPWLQSLLDPDPLTVKSLLQSPFMRSVPELDADAFYVAAVTKNQGRFVLREWIETSLGEAEKNVREYFQRQELIDFDGESKPAGVYALAGSLERRMDDVPKEVPAALIANAVLGRPLPRWILQQALIRTRRDADNRVTRPRVMLIKMVLNSLHDFQREELRMSSSLREDYPDEAYHLGRLFCVLEEAQRAALGDINATITDRFFSAASSCPRSVFPRLMNGAKAHLAKLRREDFPAYQAIQQRIESVVVRLDPEHPAFLTVERQGMFTIGYYHQRAHDRAEMMQHVARKQAQTAQNPSTEETPDVHPS